MSCVRWSMHFRARCVRASWVYSCVSVCVHVSIYIAMCVYIRMCVVYKVICVYLRTEFSPCER